jgi:hypothetical protein
MTRQLTSVTQRYAALGQGRDGRFEWCALNLLQQAGCSKNQTKTICRGRGAKFGGEATASAAPIANMKQAVPHHTAPMRSIISFKILSASAKTPTCGTSLLVSLASTALKLSGSKQRATTYKASQ